MSNWFQDPTVALWTGYVLDGLRLLIWVPVLVFLWRWVRTLRQPVTLPPPIAVLVNQATRDKIYLTHNETLLGRSPGSDIVLNYPTVSRTHAVIACRDGDWRVTDTHSKTGVEVNGRLIDKSAPLKNGDLIALGGVSFVFSNRLVEPDRQGEVARRD